MIYWNGCSFVRGMEVGKKQHKFAWSVSEECNQECINHAKVGGSNDRIWRTTVNDVPQFFQPTLLITNQHLNYQDMVFLFYNTLLTM